MAQSFLDRLEISEDERRSLAALGAADAAALAGMIHASRVAFVAMIGNEARAAAIEGQVRAQLTPDECARLDEPAPRFSLGAILDRPPKPRDRG